MRLVYAIVQSGVRDFILRGLSLYTVTCSSFNGYSEMNTSMGMGILDSAHNVKFQRVCLENLKKNYVFFH